MAIASDDVMGTGKGPDGDKVTFCEEQREGIVGKPGGNSTLFVVYDSKGVKITHSDSLEGLKSAGYKLDPVKVSKAKESDAE